MSRPTEHSLVHSAVAEALGTLFLLATVVGSGIMGERLAEGNAALTLLANSLATGAILIVLIHALGPLSGAHFNPAVSLAAALDGSISWSRFGVYAGSQIAGAIAGVVLAHAMFELPLLVEGIRERSGPAQWLSEGVATFGLLFVIYGTRRRAEVVPLTVGLYITAAYWFTSSTSFANPAVTIARSFTDTFAGIRGADVFPFVTAQLIAAVAGAFLLRRLFIELHRKESSDAP